MTYLPARLQVLVIGNIVLSHLFPHPLAYGFVVADRCRKIFQHFSIMEAVRPVSHLCKYAPETYPSQNASHSNAGISTINTVIMAKEKGRFILHNSQGFRHGDGENFMNVINFLKDRKDMPNVRGQVHAVWYVYHSLTTLKRVIKVLCRLCFQVCLSAGDHLFESGVEDLFCMKSNADLGPGRSLVFSDQQWLTI